MQGGAAGRPGPPTSLQVKILYVHRTGSFRLFITDIGIGRESSLGASSKHLRRDIRKHGCSSPTTGLRDVAHRLAAAEGLVLADSHWQIIDLLRDFFDRTETSPAMRPLVKLIKEQLGEGCGSSVYLMGLFGGSPAKTAAKIAGLPRPTNCL